MTTKWEITDRVTNRIKDISSDLGSAVLVEYVEDAAQTVQSETGQSVDLTDIGSKFHPVITDMSTLYALQYMSNVGVSYNLGRTKIDKKTEIEGLKRQMMMLEARTQKQINMLGKRIEQDVINPSETQQ